MAGKEKAVNAWTGFAIVVAIISTDSEGDDRFWYRFLAGSCAGHRHVHRKQVKTKEESP